MAEQKEDKWSSEAYQHSASFVPKLATKVVQWLNVQKDDVILDIGCGDGVLDVEFGKVLAQGTGSLHGIDASPAMISAAKKAVEGAGLSNCEFEVLDATEMSTSPTPALRVPTFTKAFSNAALHWILRAPGSHLAVFASVRDALRPGGALVLEMGGLGNVGEMRTALLMAVARRGGGGPLEDVGGWRVERVEREWRPTPADRGGVEGWVRLMGKALLDAVPEEGGRREEAVREVVEVLDHVCGTPEGGRVIGYVRLRCLARKL
ncbi:methyltransferase domain-containing protein [Colletotrichum caudatum]|nr:methyltransferase domain-containing protein [Colletotrichum caudatum]